MTRPLLVFTLLLLVASANPVRAQEHGAPHAAPPKPAARPSQKKPSPGDSTGAAEHGAPAKPSAAPRQAPVAAHGKGGGATHESERPETARPESKTRVEAKTAESKAEGKAEGRTEARTAPKAEARRGTDLDAALERINQRMADVATARAVRRPVAVTPIQRREPAAAEATRQAEVAPLRLVWRVGIAWPDELLRP